MPPQPESTLITWQAPVRPFRSHSRQLVTTAATIATLVAIILAFAGEWMLIATLAALIFAYYLWSTVPPETVTHSITTWGVRAHSQLFHFEEITRYWFEDKWGHPLLVINTPGRFPVRLHLLLDKITPQQIEDALSPYLLKEKPDPTPLDRAGAWLASKFPLE